jgi:hypothetical protein|nr:MAG TPA: FIBRITIN T4, FIBRITIN, STRUCTURAL PROTEIN.2A [Caudoviricetes sp.]
MGVINKTTEEINTLLDKVEGMPEEGVVGKTPVLETGTTTTLEAGSEATSEVVANGTDESGNPKYKLNFGIPKGYDGSGGSGGGGTADSVQWANVLNKPSWVNSSTKPSYTAAEVGALPAETTIPSKTSELDNDSKFVKRTELKTINGNSIVGSGNIEISGTGSGIADAPSDGQTYGRKNGNWAAITSGTGGSVDISDLISRLTQIAEISGTCTDEDYSTLKGYADNGTVTYVNSEGTSLILNIKNISGTIILSYYIESEINFIYTVITVSSSKGVAITQKIILPYTQIGSGLLGGYTKPASYSKITKEDSISTAIGKLEAGLGTSGGGSSSDDIYYLPTAVLTLDTLATSEEIVAAFGGSDKRTELANAIKAGKKIYIQGNETYSSIPVSVLNLLGITPYLCFTRRKNIAYSEIVNIDWNAHPAIKVIKTGGYEVDGKVNLLTSSSTTSDISTALGGLSGIKKLKKAIEDGNSIYTTFYSGSSTEITSARFNLSVVILSDESKYEIIISGVQGESFLSMINVGYLYISYEISSNTFTCQRYNNAGIS